MTGPLLRVVVVTWHSGPVIGPFLSSLAGATSAPYEVVLVDNDRPDAGTLAAAQRPEAHLVRAGSNLGYGRAANLGARGASAPWLVVANPDVVWSPGSLDVLLAAGRRWPRAGALGPAIVTEDGALYPSARALPSLRRGVGHALAGWWWPTNPWTRAYRNERGAPVEGPYGWLSGSCLLLRREAFEEAGGFDPTYFMYFEDVELGRALATYGWQRVLVPAATVCHLGGHATARVPRAMLRAHHVSAYRYLARTYPGPRWAPLRLVLAAGLAARYALARVSRRAGEGARPTRSADVLADKPGPAGP